MTEEWRVSLIFNERLGAIKRASYRDLLRSRLGEDIAVSAEKMDIFLYAGTPEAAAEAEHVAREVLTQQNLRAEFRLERWDSSGETWRAARPGAPDRADAERREDTPGQGRLRSAAAALIDGVTQGVIDGFVP